MADAFVIDLTTNVLPITLVIPQDEQINLEAITGQVNFYEGFGKSYSYQLSQIDIDNKYIIISDLSTIVNKQNILLIIENAGIILEYGIDYSIVENNKIIWGGFELEYKLQAGDKLKVYY